MESEAKYRMLGIVAKLQYVAQFPHYTRYSILIDSQRLLEEKLT
jgi:hypothetical protein